MSMSWRRDRVCAPHSTARTTPIISSRWSSSTDRKAATEGCRLGLRVKTGKKEPPSRDVAARLVSNGGERMEGISLEALSSSP